MYFGFGQHPAFNCPLDRNKNFDDYFIEFNEEDVENKKLHLSYELFEKYPTYIINHPKSSVFILSDGENKVVMRISDAYQIFALWTPHAPFICLEPWVNHLDRNDTATPFEQRDGNLSLQPGEIYEIGYSIQIL